MTLAETGVSIELFISVMTPAFGALATAVVYLWRQQSRMHAEAVAWRDGRIRSLEENEKRLEKRIEELENKVNVLEAEKATLKTQFLMLSSSHDSSPLPMWIKDLGGKVIACNKAYEAHFLIPRGYRLADYLGHDDGTVWPDAIAAEYRKNDESVYRTGKIFDGTESIVDTEGNVRPVRIIKWPRHASGIEQPFGIAGIAVPDIIAI